MRRVAKSLQLDLAIALRSAFRNSLAGCVFVPRILRTMLYRASGLDISSFNIREGQRIESGSLRIGDRTFINRGCVFEGSGRIDIGADCQVGPETMFITSNHERRSDGSVSDDSAYGDICVAEGSWIGGRVVVLPGAVIEENCIIAAGAVVRGRCLAGRTYGGVPARLIDEPASER
jgi:maltose O-acetyltransferase